MTQPVFLITGAYQPQQVAVNEILVRATDEAF